MLSMISDNISFFEVNVLIFLAINSIRYFGRQHADTNSIFKEMTKIGLSQNIAKDFLQDHINNLVIDEKIINKINRNKN